MADWSTLLPDLLNQIAKKITSFEDFVAFSSVCTSWRSSAAIETKPRKLFGSTLFMLPARGRTNIREFYNLSSHKICKISLPEVNSSVCLFSCGWLMTVTQDSKTNNLNLLHPVSRVQIKLPGIMNIMSDSSVKFRLSSNPSSTPNYVVSIFCSKNNSLMFWKSGDKKWKIISDTDPSIRDIIFYKDRLYVVYCRPFNWYIDCYNINGANNRIPTKEQRFTRRLPLNEMGFQFPEKVYSVESNGALLLILHIKSQSNRLLKRFQVYDIMNGNGIWATVTSLGNRSLFLDDKSAISIEVRDNCGFKANCIYYMDYYPMESFWYMVVHFYNMQDGTIELYFKQKFEVFPPCQINNWQHLWIQANF